MKRWTSCVCSHPSPSYLSSPYLLISFDYASYPAFLFYLTLSTFLSASLTISLSLSASLCLSLPLSASLWCSVSTFCCFTHIHERNRSNQGPVASSAGARSACSGDPPLSVVAPLFDMINQGGRGSANARFVVKDKRMFNLIVHGEEKAPVEVPCLVRICSVG